MSALPPPIADRLSKIIGRLASDHDGEIIAAAGAIRRTLQSAGHDLNDLAAHVGAPPQTLVVYRDRPSERPNSTWRSAARQVNPILRHKESVARCQRLDAGRLSAWERDFLASVTLQLNQHRDLTSKQASVLTGIVAKLEGRSS